MGASLQAVVHLLFGLATLAVVNVSNPQDWTRLELTRSIALRGSLQVPADLPIDKALYGGHTYADKAPGMSVVAIPAFELERALGVAKPRSQWDAEGDLSVWGLRLGAGGILFLLAVWLVMRTAEEVPSPEVFPAFKGYVESNGTKVEQVAQDLHRVGTIYRGFDALDLSPCAAFCAALPTQGPAKKQPGALSSA